MRFIFQPTADFLSTLDGLLPDSFVGIREGFETCLVKLQTGLDNACSSNEWDVVISPDQMTDETTMPARSPWELIIACVALENQFGNGTDRLQARFIDKGDMFGRLRDSIQGIAKIRNLYGGFPRMTFCTLDETRKEPTIVLGFTAASWSNSSGPLQAWAKKARGDSLVPYRNRTFLVHRANAVTQLRAVETKVKATLGLDAWDPTRIQTKIERLRDLGNLKPFGQGPRGLAIEFPNLNPRMRCLVCLASTEYDVAAEEKPLGSASMQQSAYENYAESCAEVETALLIIKHSSSSMRYWRTILTRSGGTN
ncbi:MAG: hypothetical protein Q9170_001387 [Blastenia crenularia]